MGRNVIMHVSHTNNLTIHSGLGGTFTFGVCDFWPGVWQSLHRGTAGSMARLYSAWHQCNLQLPVAGTLNTGARTLQLLVFLAACKMLASRETERETSPPIRISAVEGQCKLSPIPTRWSQHCSPEHLPSSQSPAIAQTNPSTTRTLIQVELSQTSRGGIVN